MLIFKVKTRNTNLSFVFCGILNFSTLKLKVGTSVIWAVFCCVRCAVHLGTGEGKECGMWLFPAELKSSICDIHDVFLVYSGLS